MAKILLIEDHENICQSLQECLSSEGYDVDVAKTVHEGQAKLELRPDLIVLDWNLPDGQGLDFLTDLRKKGKRTPVVFLTARAELVDKVLGLEMGADDYMTKPFESRELIARIRVRLRDLKIEEPLASSPPTVLRVGSLSIDKIRRQVSFGKVEIDLVKKEFDLLAQLAESPEKVFSRDEILNKVWGYDVYPTTRTVDTHVLQLRQKIHEDLIETVRAVGYRLRPLST